MKVSIETNINSTKYKHAVIWAGNGTIDDPKWCLGSFTNKKAATKMANFLNWYQQRFGDFSDIQECSARLCNVAGQASIKYIPGI